jgi:mannose-1-phosphate guanylyltransferase
MAPLPLHGLGLAGGDGMRLQALTRALTGAPIPKQYCRITGDRSLLELTLARIAPLVPPERTLVVVNRDHLPLAAAQLRALPAANVLVQPANRDTGPGLLFSLRHFARRHPGAMLAVFPSDHHIRDDRAFLAHLERAAATARRLPGKLVLLGIRPDRVEPGLGYIEPAGPLGASGVETVLRVAAFQEKPGAEAAERLIARGALWNSFVMVFTPERALELVRETRPADYARMEHGEAAYAGLPPWNFSRDFLARIPEHLVTVPIDGIGWSDWGTPEAVVRSLAAVA